MDEELTRMVEAIRDALGVDEAVQEAEAVEDVELGDE